MNFASLVDRFYNKSPKIRLLISKILFGNKDICIKLFDLDLEINTLRESGYFRAFNISKNSSLLRDELAVLMNISMVLDKEDTFVDVGANIGIFSSLISRFSHLNPNFNTYAFEANPDTYKRLEKNSIKNGFQAFNVGVSAQECELEFLDGAVSHVFTTVENATDYNIKDKTIKVKCKRLDQFDLIGDSIVIKIDVEGQELAVLEGAIKLFDSKRIKAVYLDGFSHQEKVLSFLDNYGFSFFDGRNLMKSDGKIFSLLAVSKEKL
jgi:FkbM family methyltransferase